MPAALAATYYVDATIGVDSNPGTGVSPFRTIQRAASVMVPGDVCIVRAGTYREEVRPASNGVTFRAAPGETVVVTAFEPVTGWTVHRNNIYKADIGWTDLGDQNQVFYNGEMMTLARWPNKTNFNPFDIEALSASGTTSSISHASIPAWNWANGGVVWYLGKNGWTSWRQPITGSAAGVINFNTLSTDWQYAGSHSPAQGGEVILMNILEALDAGGEWYIDRSADRVYLQTPNGEDPDLGTALLRRRTTVFNLANRTGVQLDGLRIEGGSVDLSGADSCIVENCRIHFGNHTIASTSAAFVADASIRLTNSSRNNIIRRNDIQWGAANGITLDGTNNQVINNHIGNFNYLGSYGSPVLLGGANTLTRNRIFNGGRDLVRGGGNGSVVSYNDMHHSSLINDDCAAIYLCCNSFGYTRIHHNWIHDGQSRDENFTRNKTVGVYLDNSSMQVIVDHNVIWNIERACIQINWAGTDLLIYNNTLWSTAGSTSTSMARWANGFSLTNVPVWNTLANQNTWFSTSWLNNRVVPATDDPFEDFAGRNFTPKAGTTAVDAGRIIPGYTDGFLGLAPDVGAYERGAPHWKPGPDWDISPSLKLILTPSSNNNLHLSAEELTALAGYRVEQSTDLEAWIPLTTLVSPITGSHRLVELPRLQPKVFYRVSRFTPLTRLFQTDFSAAEGFRNRADLNGVRGMDSQPAWDADDTGGTGFATSSGSWARARNTATFTLQAGQSVVIETTLRLADADGVHSSGDNFKIGFAESTQNSGGNTPSIGATIRTNADGSYWFGGSTAANRIFIPAASSTDWIRFTQVITRTPTPGQFSIHAYATNSTTGLDLGAVSYAWTESTTDGSWGGTLTASFRTLANTGATALQIDRWKVSISAP